MPKNFRIDKICLLNGSVILFLFSIPYLYIQNKISFTNHISDIHLRLFFQFCHAVILTTSLFIMLSAAYHYYKKPNRVIRYLADAAYWKYLVAIIMILILQLLLYPLKLHPVVNTLATFIFTLSLCLISYQLFVRHTKIGAILTGKSVRKV